MKSVAILSKPGRAELAEVFPGLLQWLKSHAYSIVVDSESAPHAPGVQAVARTGIATHHPDFVVVLGGDGTLLAAARAVAREGIPILAVNLGSLGFLSEVTLSELYPTLEALENRCCSTQHRHMLHCQLVRGGKCVAEYEALNDAVVSKSALARMVDLELRIGGVFVCSYKADGLILSTPTGSTAYSLAAGGPIIAPDTEAFVITPVSPHALTNRPLVVRDTAQMEITVREKPDEAYLTVDGQVGMSLQAGDTLSCNKSKHTVQLLRMGQRTFFDVLRMKLKWGER